MRRLLWRLRGTLLKTRRDRSFADELDAHLQSHIDDNVRSGMTLDQARRDALLKLGGRAAASEAWRDRRGLPVVESFARDVRFALRTLRRNPGFASAATTTRSSPATCPAGRPHASIRWSRFETSSR